MKFQKESFFDLTDEFIELIPRHADDSPPVSGKVAAPNWNLYKILELQGVLRCYTVRNEEGQLVGYYTVFIQRHFHYDLSVAMCDTLYVEKGYRLHVMKFIKYVETQLRESGVEYVVINVKPMRDFRKMLKRLGYDFVEFSYGKRIN